MRGVARAASMKWSSQNNTKPSPPSAAGRIKTRRPLRKNSDLQFSAKPRHRPPHRPDAAPAHRSDGRQNSARSSTPLVTHFEAERLSRNWSKRNRAGVILAANFMSYEPRITSHESRVKTLRHHPPRRHRSTRKRATFPPRHWLLNCS